MSSATKVPAKKQYQKPGLKVYGNIAVLTAAVLNTSSTTDGGSIGIMTKTH